MVEVALLRYYHGVMNALMTEVHPHGCPRFRPSTTPLNWAGHQPCLHRKRHHVHPGIIAPACFVALLSWIPLLHAMLVLSVRIQLPPRQVLPVFREANQLPLSLLVAPP